jgi:hypothetical protein
VDGERSGDTFRPIGQVRLVRRVGGGPIGARSRPAGQTDLAPTLLSLLDRSCAVAVVLPEPARRRSRSTWCRAHTAIDRWSFASAGDATPAATIFARLAATTASRRGRAGASRARDVSLDRRRRSAADAADAPHEHSAAVSTMPALPCASSPLLSFSCRGAGAAGFRAGSSAATDGRRSPRPCQDSRRLAAGGKPRHAPGRTLVASNWPSSLSAAHP